MYTKHEFEYLMNESFPPIVIGGREYGRGTVLASVDPEQFNIDYHDWLHYLDECEEDRVN
jgi:hypothetical protein